MSYPYLVIQSDWEDVLRGVNGKVWITCKSVGQQGIHGELTNNGISSSGNPYIFSSDKFSVQSISKITIKVQHEDPNCSCLFIAPVSSFSAVHNKSIQCLDVSSGGLGVSVCTDKKLHIWNTNDGTVRRELSGHVGDVYACKFFPSGLVILTGSADLRLKIWSAETGDCPVILTGHVAAIQDIAMVERGKNIISVSKDGSARLWNCSSTECIAVIYKCESAINCCCITDVSQEEINLGKCSQPAGENEIGTAGKLLFIGAEDGFVRAVGIETRSVVYEYNCGSAVNTCAALSPTVVVCGTHNGSIFVLNIKEPSQPVQSWHYSASPVLSLLPYKDGFFFSKGDGTCMFNSVHHGMVMQLSGPDCDPVYKLVSDGQHVYSCCRDGIIRKYRIPAT